MPIEPETSLTGSAITSRKRLRERIVLISTRRSDEVIAIGAKRNHHENGVSVQTRLSEGALPVEGDRVQLQQVVLNLILNAVEAMSSVETGARDCRSAPSESQPNERSRRCARFWAGH